MTDLGIAGITDAELIASGGSALVYKAVNADADAVAVKVLRGMRGDEIARRFEREQKATELLAEHPNIIDVLAAGTTDAGEPYLIMPLVEGGSLQDELEADGPFTTEQAVADVRLASAAIEHAHHKGVLHRDIKPGNLLRCDDGSIVVTDFGIARVKDAGITSATIGASTPLYAAPELLAENDASVQSEVYALGALLYALVAGRPAFADSANLWATMHKIRTEEPPTLTHIPAPIMRVIERAMAKEPHDRFVSVRAFSDYLEDALHADADWSPPAPAATTIRVSNPAADLPYVPVVPATAAPALPAAAEAGAGAAPAFDRPAPPIDAPPSRNNTGRILTGVAALVVIGGLVWFGVSRLTNGAETEIVDAPIDSSLPVPTSIVDSDGSDGSDGTAPTSAPSTPSETAQATPGPSATPTTQLVSFAGQHFSALLPEGWSVLRQDVDVGYGYRSEFVADDMYLNIDTTPQERQTGPVDIAQSARDIAAQVSSASAVRTTEVDGRTLHSFTFVNNRGIDSIDIFFEVDGDGYAIVAGSRSDAAGAFAIAELVATTVRSQ